MIARTDDGGIEAGVRTLSPDDLPAGDVDIVVEWSAVNYKDGMVTRPGNRVARISPLVPGVDLVGTVAASDRLPTVRPGSPVIVHGYDLGVAHHGGFAEWARVPAGWVVPLPRRPRRPPGRHHRHGRLHRRTVPQPARAPGTPAPETVRCW